MHAGNRSALCLVSYLRLRPLGDLGGGWIGLMVFVCSRPQHSQLCTQRLSPGSAFTGADIDPDLHSHFQSHFAKLLLFITHIKTLNGHIGHTYTCWSFAVQGEMQVAEDNTVLWYVTLWQSYLGVKISCYNSTFLPLYDNNAQCHTVTWLLFSVQ